MRSFALAAIAVLCLNSAASAETSTFERPRIGGMRLDYCLTWASNCGQPAANAFCERRGFDAAIEYSHAPNVGVYEPTRLITGRVCEWDFCAGFHFITCVR
jgi:hypothetical protein